MDVSRFVNFKVMDEIGKIQVDDDIMLFLDVVKVCKVEFENLLYFFGFER